MRPKAHVLLIALVSISLGVPASAKALDKGWWIVVGSFPIEPSERLKKVHNAAAPCRIEIFNDFSAKFRGFAPGYNSFVMGAFASQGEAAIMLATAAPMVSVSRSLHSQTTESVRDGSFSAMSCGDGARGFAVRSPFGSGHADNEGAILRLTCRYQADRVKSHAAGIPSSAPSPR
jgi:hypothetical protein